MFDLCKFDCDTFYYVRDAVYKYGGALINQSQKDPQKSSDIQQFEVSDRTLLKKR